MLEQLVLDVIEEFVNESKLFTALDVSNKLKETQSFIKHRDVREIVRRAWSDAVVFPNYNRTNITVTLQDGTTTEAALYHHISDTWDLDSKYSDQMRKSKSLHAAANPVVTNPMSADPFNTVPSPAPVTTPLSARDLWAQLFLTQPSLFPTK
jgi:hypothetical protein